VRVAGAQLAGVFRFVDTEQPDWLGYVFVADRFDGDPRTTPEAVPAWYPCGALPLDQMWDDDRLWLPRVLAGERLEGEFLFTAGSLRAHRLRPLREPSA
jgi:8-oxo-dGTP diphosphatase